MNRDLDATIAEEIFGWRLADIPPDYDGKNAGQALTPDGQLPDGHELPRKGAVGRAYFCPSYCTYLDQALSLARHVKLPVPACELPSNAEGIARLCLDHWRSRKEGAK
jgi:hypothetical protein